MPRPPRRSPPRRSRFCHTRYRDLEALLPETLSGIALTRFSSPGSVFTRGSDMCVLICGDEPYRYATELGIDVSDVTVAFAVDDRLSIGMIAYRARGATTDRLIPARSRSAATPGMAASSTCPSRCQDGPRHIWTRGSVKTANTS